MSFLKSEKLNDFRAKIADKIQPAAIKEKAGDVSKKFSQIIEVVKAEIVKDDAPEIKQVSQEEIEETISIVEMLELQIADLQQQLKEAEATKREAEKMLKQQMETFQANHVIPAQNKTVAQARERLEKLKAANK